MVHLQTFLCEQSRSLVFQRQQELDACLEQTLVDLAAAVLPRYERRFCADAAWEFNVFSLPPFFDQLERERGQADVRVFAHSALPRLREHLIQVCHKLGNWTAMTHSVRPPVRRLAQAIISLQEKGARWNRSEEEFVPFF